MIHKANRKVKCKRCGAFSSNRVAADDNPIKLMSIAMKPLGQPPFPLERIEEMTRKMGDDFLSQFRQPPTAHLLL